MINRVLIRIKVVQQLYSYLLTEKQFTLESQPTPPTKEKRFAYRLYLDTLVLFTHLADAVRKRDGYRPLADNRFITTILADDKIRSVMARDQKALEMADADLPEGQTEPEPDMVPTPLGAPALIEALAGEIKESDIYKNYVKYAGTEPGLDLRVWRDIFNNIIVPNAAFNEACAQLPGFSPRGVERMGELMAETFVNFSSSQDHVEDALKALDASLMRARELYFRLLALAPAITALRDRQLEDGRAKHLATEADRNPSLRFVDNEWVKVLEQDPVYQEGVKEFNIDWMGENPILIQNLLKSVLVSEVYQDYMASSEKSWDADCQLWHDLLRNVVLPNPELSETLEDTNIYWNDDLDFIGTFVLKTVRRFQNGDPEPMLPMYKDDEDALFGRDLFTLAVSGKDQYKELISSALNKDTWEPDRLAFMDVVIMLCAFAEILNFDKIPVGASINEYIEIARAYSTPKSPFFINGVLGGAVSKLRADGQLLKP